MLPSLFLTHFLFCSCVSLLVLPLFLHPFIIVCSFRDLIRHSSIMSYFFYLYSNLWLLVISVYSLYRILIFVFKCLKFGTPIFFSCKLFFYVHTRALVVASILCTPHPSRFLHYHPWTFLLFLILAPDCVHYLLPYQFSPLSSLLCNPYCTCFSGHPCT